MVIGLVGILHVIISHGVAIGLMAFLTLAEYLGVWKDRPGWEEHAERMLKPAAIVITGVGAVTGAGIWFTTSALSPRGIGSMLRVFFWPWFIEWAIFALEVGALLYYYFHWKRWARERRKNRLYFGCLYVSLAVLSAVLITGILGFMLTPDGWPWDRAFASAFLNPSFFPQLFFRLGLSFVLGSIFVIAFLLFANYRPEFRSQALPLHGAALGLSAGLTLAFAAWYFAVVPSRFKAQAIFSVLTSHLSGRPGVFWTANLAGALVLAGLAAACLVRRTGLARVLAVPALLFSIAFTTEFERVREFIRGPYLMPGYLYSNQILLVEHEYFRSHPLLGDSPWFHGVEGRASDGNAEGAFLFLRNCSCCHTSGGINDIGDRSRELSRDGIAVILGHLHEMVPFMPPFSGTEEERQKLASFLDRLARGEVRLRARGRVEDLK
jgi:hypothetical protein